MARDFSRIWTGESAKLLHCLTGTLLSYSSSTASLTVTATTTSLTTSTSSVESRQLHIYWNPLQSPVHLAHSHAPEFDGYVDRFGTAYIHMYEREGTNNGRLMTALFGNDDSIFGGEIGAKLFFLPCTLPTTHEETLNAASEALSAVLAYRRRLSIAMPDWIADFHFSSESVHRSTLADLHRQIAVTEDQLVPYAEAKSALCANRHHLSLQSSRV